MLLVVLAAALPACSEPEGGDDTRAAACPPQGSGTTHDANVETDEVWTAAGSPHLVPGTISIRSGAKLTIEPCAEVRMGADASLQIAIPPTPNTGGLIAEGTAERPIRFTGIDGGRWGHVLVVAPGTASLRHVTFEGGGNDRSPYNATLIVQGTGELPVSREVRVDHVTIEGSVGYGAVLEHVAGFAPGSAALTISGSGSDEQPYPLRVGEHGVDGLPDGSYTGNRVDGIFIAMEGANKLLGLQASATFRDLGVPYHVGEGGRQSLRVEPGPGGENTILTIEPGVVVKFHPQSNFEIEHFTGNDVAKATVVAVGTPDEPIVFTSAEPAPAAGDWQGLWFGGIPNEQNRLEHVRIEYAGHDCLCSLHTCNEIQDQSSAIILTNPPLDGFSIKNVTIADSAGHGIHRGWRHERQPSFKETNTFENVPGCVQTLPEPPTGNCGGPRIPCPFE